jgi:hypothetical protein
LVGEGHSERRAKVSKVGLLDKAAAKENRRPKSLRRKNITTGSTGWKRFFERSFERAVKHPTKLEIRPAGEPGKNFKIFSKRRLTLRRILAISPSPLMGTE